MSRRDFYTLKKDSPTAWKVYKVDEDFNPSSTRDTPSQYAISDINDHLECTCFASNKNTCRHRDIVRMYKSNGEFRQKMDGGAKYNYDKDTWLEPLTG